MKRYDYSYITKQGKRAYWHEGSIYGDNLKDARKNFEKMYGYTKHNNVPYPFHLHIKLHRE